MGTDADRPNVRGILTDAGRRGVALLGVVLFAGCSDSPTDPGANGYATEDLTTQLAIAPSHLHTWEHETTFTVSVVDPADQPVIDFELIQLDRLREGTDTWMSLELALDGDAYVGTLVFEVSGDYDIRVTGIRPSDEELKVLHQLEQPVAVVPAHAHMGGYEVAFEAVPGHVHAGEESTLTFWFTEEAAGGEHPAEGLSATIFVDVDGTETTYPADEPDPGMYVADHLFDSVGPATVGVRFLDSDETEREWSLQMTIHAPQ